MAALAPDELVCDMAETYHVLDWRTLGLPLAATLAGGLLGAMADSLQLLVWSKTKDAQHGRNRPTPVLDTLLGTAHRRKVTGFATAAEFEAAKAEILKGG